MYIRLFINRQDFYLCTPMNAVSFTDTLSARRHQPVLVPTDQHSIADTGANAKKDPSSLPKTPWKQHNWAFSWSPYLTHIPWRASDSHGLTTSSKQFFFFCFFPTCSSNLFLFKMLNGSETHACMRENKQSHFQISIHAGK